jgi:hypothetical protein
MKPEICPMTPKQIEVSSVPSGHSNAKICKFQENENGYKVENAHEAFYS